MGDTDHITAQKPSDAKVFQALVLVAGLLGHRYTYFHRGRYHFAIDDEWSVAVSPESGNRFRVEACRYTVPVGRVWALAENPERLAGLVINTKDAIGRLTATGGTHG